MKKEQDFTSAKQTSPWPFFVLSFVLTWIFWIAIALAGRDVMGRILRFRQLFAGRGHHHAGGD